MTLISGQKFLHLGAAASSMASIELLLTTRLWKLSERDRGPDATGGLSRSILLIDSMKLVMSSGDSSSTLLMDEPEKVRERCWQVQCCGRGPRLVDCKSPLQVRQYFPCSSIACLQCLHVRRMALRQSLASSSPICNMESQIRLMI